MKLLYDKNDLPHSRKMRDERFKWLDELGASELSSAALDEAGFLFGYEHGDEHYRKLVGNRPNVHCQWALKGDQREALQRRPVGLRRRESVRWMVWHAQPFSGDDSWRTNWQ